MMRSREQSPHQWDKMRPESFPPGEATRRRWLLQPGRRFSPEPAPGTLTLDFQTPELCDK